jgi:hypothetical protein
MKHKNNSPRLDSQKETESKEGYNGLNPKSETDLSPSDLIFMGNNKQ